MPVRCDWIEIWSRKHVARLGNSPLVHGMIRIGLV